MITQKIIHKNQHRKSHFIRLNTVESGPRHIDNIIHNKLPNEIICEDDFLKKSEIS